MITFCGEWIENDIWRQIYYCLQVRPSFGKISRILEILENHCSISFKLNFLAISRQFCAPTNSSKISIITIQLFVDLWKLTTHHLKMSIWNDNCSLGDGYTIENCNYDDELLNFTVDFSNEQICKNGFFFFLLNLKQISNSQLTTLKLQKTTSSPF